MPLKQKARTARQRREAQRLREGQRAIRRSQEDPSSGSPLDVLLRERSEMHGRFDTMIIVMLIVALALGVGLGGLLMGLFIIS